MTVSGLEMLRQQAAPLALAGALLFGLGGCAAIDRNIEAAQLLRDLSAGEEHSRLKARTAAPTVEEIRYRIDEHEYVANLYRSGERPRAALVLMHGLSEYGKDDPRLQLFAQSLTRAGFNLLVPDIPGLREFRVSPEDTRYVVDAIRFLAAQPEIVPDERLGAAGFSYAVGPLLLAAMDPRSAQLLDFAVAIGGYYDIVDAIAFVTTGYTGLGDAPERRQPQRQAAWYFIMSYLDRLEDPQDRDALEQIADRRSIDPEANVDDLAAQLGPEGRAVYALIVNRDPERVPELIEQLPQAVRKDIATLDLANEDLSRLRAKLLLIHGVDDDIIPASHSQALDARLPSEQARLYLVSGLYHVDIDPGFFDSLRLWRAATALLRLRDGLGP